MAGDNEQPKALGFKGKAEGIVKKFFLECEECGEITEIEFEESKEE